MTKECKAAAEYLMAHDDDWFDDGVRSGGFEPIECFAYGTAQECPNCPVIAGTFDGWCVTDSPIDLEKNNETFEDKLNRIIFGTGFTDKEIELLNQRYDELLNEWLVENEHHFDSKEEAIEYYIFCERGGQCD